MTVLLTLNWSPASVNTRFDRLMELEHKTKSKSQIRILLIIGILVLSFSISFLLRMQPAEFGLELNEFDPFFNFRATEFLVNNGLESYFAWNDELSWYPNGRDVSATSQTMLHLTAGLLYTVFGFNSDLYSFTIYFPIVIGSLTTVIIFLLIRQIGGNTSGLFAALIFSVSPIIIQRGTIGWFKSEPLGLMFGLLAVYLFLSAINSSSREVKSLKFILSGIVLALGLSAWGGTLFFLLPVALYIIILPFLKKENNFYFWGIPIFTISLILTSLIFERPGTMFVGGIGGFSIIGVTIFLIVFVILRKIISDKWTTKIGLMFLGTSILVGIGIISSGLLQFPYERYIAAANPFISYNDPLFLSISEHSSISIEFHFFLSSVLIGFAGLGVWSLTKKIPAKNSDFLIINNEMRLFAILISFLGFYIGLGFYRLLIFEAISIIILSSLGLTILIKKVIEKNWKGTSKKNKIIKPVLMILIITIILVPLVYPSNINWVTLHQNPPTILNGGTIYRIASTDVLESLEWIRTNTSKDSVIASWWDYGYWISTLGERTTLIDGATLSFTRIALIADVFLSDVEDGWKVLHDENVDYLLIFVISEKFDDESNYYKLLSGGDQSKVNTFASIAGMEPNQFYEKGSFVLNDNFWENTLLGKLLPFEKSIYYNPTKRVFSEIYNPGYYALYEKEFKFDNNNQPFKLVYSSSSLNIEDSGVILGVLLYDVSDDYYPNG